MNVIKRQSQNIVRYLNKLNEWLVIIAALIVVATMVCVTYAAVKRYFFDAPVGWVIELTSYALLFIVFLSIAYAQQLNQHIRVDVVLTRVSKKMQDRMGVAALSVSLFFWVIFTWSTTKYAQWTFVNHFHSDTDLHINLFLIRVMMPIGGFLISLQLLIALIRQLTVFFTRNNGKGEEQDTGSVVKILQEES